MVVVWVVGEIDQSLPIKSFETIISSYSSGIFSTIKYNFLNKLYGQIAKAQSKQTLTVKTCNNKCSIKYKIVFYIGTNHRK